MSLEPSYPAMTAWLRQFRRPLLMSHRRPDGDAIGSLAGMSLALRQLGVDPAAALFEPFPARYALVEPLASWRLWPAEQADLINRSDAVVILDTCALSQLEPIAGWLTAAPPPILVVDHHLTSDPVGVRAADMRVIDDTAAATCALVAEWARAAGVQLNPAMATALFMGLATDCGWFRFSNTDARALRLAADLVAGGARPDLLYQAIYQRDEPGKLRLIARMLNSLQLYADGKLAVMTLRQADFAAAGADGSATEDLINEAARLGSTEATLLFTEEADGQVRVNLRSKNRVDVAQIAAHFGGGGHARAAGARARAPLDEVALRVIDETLAALGESQP
jgi:bifunctional oligoribonuclease and PAP phosphatase NrnA